MKKCSNCKTLKSLDGFWKNKRLKSGLDSWCKDCRNKYRKSWGQTERGKALIKQRERRRHRTEKRTKWRQEYYKTEKSKKQRRNSHLKFRFNLTTNEFVSMEKAQHGLCAICGLSETHTYKGKIKKLSVDHNHFTGQVRGLLCCECNTAIGKLKVDNLGILNLQMAIKDLEIENND